MRSKSAHPNLTLREMKAMRSLHGMGLFSFVEIGQHFGVSYQTVSHVVKGNRTLLSGGGSVDTRTRTREGVHNGRNKYTGQSIHAMRVLAAAGVSRTLLSKAFGSSPNGVSKIVRGERWPQIGTPTVESLPGGPKVRRQP